MTRKVAPTSQVVTQGAVTLRVYEVNRGNRTVFSVSHKEEGCCQLKQFSGLEAALNWASRRTKEIDRGQSKSITLEADDAASYEQAKKFLAGSGKTIAEAAREYP